MTDIRRTTPAFAMGGDIIDILLKDKELTEEQASQVRSRMRRSQIPAHQAMLELGFSTQEHIYRALSQTTGIPFVILGETEIKEDATQKVTPKVALRYQFVPISLERGTLKAAFSTPPSIPDRETLRLLLGLRLDPVIATPNEVSNTLKRIYGLGAGKVIQITQERKNAQLDTQDNAFNDKEEQNLDVPAGSEEDASIIPLVNEIISEAIKQHATDIHIEPFRDKIRLRYRIDG
ncbi:MAG: hypothetical protein IJT83_08120, partial [Victivallales bacterium]|nr:hypothetical protein [Victivallales bacterium]